MTASYCVECDAPPAQCEHRGARYREPIVYERAAGHGWKVPALERARWENPPALASAPQPAPEPRPLQTLVVELEAWVDLDPWLEAKLRAVYELTPARVSRIVETTVREAEAGNLHRPAGYLVKRLRELE